MPDPLGFIGSPGALGRDTAGLSSLGRGASGGPDFKELLQQQIAQVNELQRDAKEAIEDVAAGRRNDVESVMLATLKADAAFKLLLGVRNKVMEAYDEVKQIRV